MLEKERKRSSAAQRGKGTAKQCIVRRTRKHSKGRRKRKEH